MNPTQSLTLEQAMQTALQFFQQGQWAQAENLYRQILQQHADNAEALNLLGVCRAQQGDDAQALHYVQQAVQKAPKDADYQNNLGNVYLQQERFVEAQECFVKALKSRSKFATAQMNLGVALKKQKKLDEAVKALRKAVKLNPKYAKAWYTLGAVYLEQKQLPTAKTALQKALQLEPKNADALTALGSWYQAKQDFDSAIKYHQKALKVRPDFIEAYKNLGVTYRQAEQYQEAVKTYQQALEIKPEAELACKVGVLFSEKLYEKTAALEYFKLTLQLDDSYADAYNGIAAIQVLRGEITAALANFRQARTLDSDNHVGWLNEAFTRNYIAEEPLELWQANQPFSQHYPSETFPQRLKPQHCANQQRLRIGYLSHDFRDHSVAYFMQSIFAQHDKEKFEIFVYHRSETQDAMSDRLRDSVEHWHSCSTWTDAQCVQQIRQDRIDILLDLGGYTNRDLIALFTQKPAPLQIAYLGYPGTTRLSCMDYRLVDTATEPPDYAQQYSSEPLLYLPHSYFCYQPPSLIENLPVTPPPVLHKGFITFGSFNNVAKMSDTTVATWAAILQQVTDARLLLKTKIFSDAATQTLFQTRFAQHGIAAERLIFKGVVVDKTEHFALYGDIDIALDTYPYNGATTTCEALWMGVPVLSRCGKTHPSRMGLSILSSVGLADLVSQNAEDFIQNAVALAQDPARLSDLRSRIREQMQASPLMQPAPFTRHLEALYQQAWADYCA